MEQARFLFSMRCSPRFPIAGSSVMPINILSREFLPPGVSRVHEIRGGRIFVPGSVLLLSLVLAACGGGGGNNSAVEDAGDSAGEDASDQDGLNQEIDPDTGIIGEVGEPSEPVVDVPDELAELDQIGLTIDAAARCATAGQSFDLTVTRTPSQAELDAGVPDEPQDVSAYVTLTQGLGQSLELLSRGDGAIQLQHRQQDIVGLTAEVGNGSTTAYLAGFASDAPTPVLLQKPVPGGCLYALRTPGYCATGIARSGQFSIGIADQAIFAQGCELENPAGHPVVQLDTAVE